MKLGRVDLERDILLIAEIGNNHEGSFERAKELVEAAAACGVHGVKFQTFRTEHYVSHADQSRFDRLKSFELSLPQFEQLASQARRLGLLFLSTPFDLMSVAGLERLVDAYKIASGDITFLPLLEQVAAAGKPLILSTGGSTLSEIHRAISAVRQVQDRRNCKADLALLHCVSAYPTPLEQVNLAAIRTLQQTFRCVCGFSDHALGIEAAVLAAACGARIIEKHFTLRHDQSSFRDHQLSADPAQMKELVARLAQVQAMLGQGLKKPQPCEEANLPLIRRSIAASCDLPGGTMIEPEHLTWLRPAGGLAPGQEHQLLGQRLAVPIAAGQAITTDHLKATDEPCALRS